MRTRNEIHRKTRRNKKNSKKYKGGAAADVQVKATIKKKIKLNKTRGGATKMVNVNAAFSYPNIDELISELKRLRDDNSVDDKIKNSTGKLITRNKKFNEQMGGILKSYLSDSRYSVVSKRVNELIEPWISGNFDQLKTLLPSIVKVGPQGYVNKGMALTAAGHLSGKSSLQKGAVSSFQKAYLDVNRESVSSSLKFLIKFLDDTTRSSSISHYVACEYKRVDEHVRRCMMLLEQYDPSQPKFSIVRSDLLTRIQRFRDFLHRYIGKKLAEEIQQSALIKFLNLRSKAQLAKVLKSKTHSKKVRMIQAAANHLQTEELVTTLGVNSYNSIGVASQYAIGGNHFISGLPDFTPDPRVEICSPFFEPMNPATSSSSAVGGTCFIHDIVENMRPEHASIPVRPPRSSEDWMGAQLEGGGIGAAAPGPHPFMSMSEENPLDRLIEMFDFPHIGSGTARRHIDPATYQRLTTKYYQLLDLIAQKRY